MYKLLLVYTTKSVWDRSKNTHKLLSRLKTQPKDVHTFWSLTTSSVCGSPNFQNNIEILTSIIVFMIQQTMARIVLTNTNITQTKYKWYVTSFQGYTSPSFASSNPPYRHPQLLVIKYHSTAYSACGNPHMVLPKWYWKTVWSHELY